MNGGPALKRHCEAKLSEAQARVERVVLAEGGALGVKPLDPDRG